MQKEDLLALSNFDFLARSFAHMHALGHPIDIRALTGNMTGPQKVWFCARYDYYRKLAQRAKVKELETC